MKKDKTQNEEIKNEVTDANPNEVKVTVTSEVSSDDIAPIDVSKIDLYEVDTNIDVENFEALVEEKRKNIQDSYKKAKRISNFVTLGMVVLVIASIILISQEMQALKITGYCIGGAALVGMLVYYALNRNKMPNKMQDYMKSVNNIFNAYLYKDPRYGKVSSNMDEKVDMGEVASDRVYANIKGLGSRGVIHGSFNDKPFMVADVKAVALSSKSKEEDLFVGKYLSCENGYKFDGRAILNICLKGQKTYDLPTDINDLEQVEGDGQMTIWATPGLDYKKIFTKDILAKINNIEVKEEKHVYNLNVVVWGGHTAVYVSYDNSVMAFPFEEEFKKGGIERFKQDQEIIFDIFEMMSKNKQIKCVHVEPKASEEPAKEEPAKLEEPSEAKQEEVKAEEPSKEEEKTNE